MPFPNEHSCRLKPPSDFQDGSFRRTSRKSGEKPYSVIMGKLKDEDAMTEQAYRYPKDAWEADEAKAHCKEHEGAMFEPAGEAEKSADDLESMELDIDEAERVEAAQGTKTEDNKLILRKAANGVVVGEIKETDQGPVGTGRATFSTFNVVDRDRDITEPGAIQAGQQIKICGWGHAWNQIPIGKGVIGTDGTRAWVDFELFLDIPAAKDHYVALKNLGELTEWSYGFEVLEYAIKEVEGRSVRVLKKLSVFEASPVMVGAGLNTRTDSIKEAAVTGLKFADHSEMIVSELAGYIGRLDSLSSLRAKENRVLSTANVNTINSVLEMLEQITTRLSGLRDQAAPKDKDEKSSPNLRAEMNRARFNIERSMHNIRGLVKN